MLHWFVFRAAASLVVDHPTQLRCREQLCKYDLEFVKNATVTISCYQQNSKIELVMNQPKSDGGVHIMAMKENNVDVVYSLSNGTEPHILRLSGRANFVKKDDTPTNCMVQINTGLQSALKMDEYWASDLEKHYTSICLYENDNQCGWGFDAHVSVAELEEKTWNFTEVEIWVPTKISTPINLSKIGAQSGGSWLFIDSWDGEISIYNYDGHFEYLYLNLPVTFCEENPSVKGVVSMWRGITVESGAKVEVIDGVVHCKREYTNLFNGNCLHYLREDFYPNSIYITSDKAIFSSGAETQEVPLSPDVWKPVDFTHMYNSEIVIDVDTNAEALGKIVLSGQFTAKFTANWTKFTEPTVKISSTRPVIIDGASCPLVLESDMSFKWQEYPVDTVSTVLKVSSPNSEVSISGLELNQNTNVMLDGHLSMLHSGYVSTRQPNSVFFNSVGGTTSIKSLITEKAADRMDTYVYLSNFAIMEEILIRGWKTIRPSNCVFGDGIVMNVTCRMWYNCPGIIFDETQKGEFKPSAVTYNLYDDEIIWVDGGDEFDVWGPSTTTYRSARNSFSAPESLSIFDIGKLERLIELNYVGIRREWIGKVKRGYTEPNLRIITYDNDDYAAYPGYWLDIVREDVSLAQYCMFNMWLIVILPITGLGLMMLWFAYMPMMNCVNKQLIVQELELEGML